MRKKIWFLACAAALLPAFGQADAAEYAGSDSCFNCHPNQYNDWRVSGHPFKVQKAEDAKKTGLPLPAGYSWDDITYVIGGAHKKARYMDKDGYIITMTGPNRDVPGKNQYNIEANTWSDYHPGEKKKYSCGGCHTTGYKKEGNQDGLKGIVGTWAAPGVHCEACHGPASEHVATGDKSKVKVDKSAAACGKCHIRGDKEKNPAGGGFIKHHQTYNEMTVTEAKFKSKMDCVTCHDPHKRAKFGIKKDCSSCHGKQDKDYAGTAMQQVGVTCVNCHMPNATKSAVAKGKYEADIATHLFKINTDPKAKMFFDEEKDGKKVTFSKGFVTLEYACLSCHKNKDINWAAAKAKGIHSYGKK